MKPWERYGKEEGPWSRYAEAQSRAQSVRETKPDAEAARRAMGRSDHDEGFWTTMQGLTFDTMDEIGGAARAVGQAGENAGRRLLGMDTEGQPTASEEYVRFRDGIRNATENFREANPKRAIAAELGGGLATGLAGGAKAVGAQTLRQASARGAGLGAASGGAYGFGNDEGSLAERADGAAEGAIAGGLFGGALPGVGAASGRIKAAIGEGVERLPVPDLSRLKELKDAAYKRVDELGVAYSPEQFSTLRQAVVDDMPAPGMGEVSRRSQPVTAETLSRMGGRADDRPVPLTELDALRSFAGGAQPTNPADGRLAGTIRQNIDDFTASTPPSQGMPGAPEALKSAREANRRYANSQRLQELVEKAKNRAASTGSGGNVENAIRQNVRRLLDDPKARRFLNDQELAQVKRVVRGSAAQNAARLIGKAAPSGIVSGGISGGLGFQLGGPVGAAAFMGTGQAGKMLAEHLTKRSIKELEEIIALGGPQAKAARQELSTRGAVPGGLLGAQTTADR